MSDILWLLYFADLACSFSTFLVLICVIGLLVVGVITLCASIDADELRTVPAWVTLVFVICGLIACFIPSKETIYAMAASKAGRQALATDTGDKAVKALNAWLDRQIAPEKDK